MGPTSLPQCPSLCRAIAHRISVSASEKLNKSMDIRFVILSDPQLGLLENYVEQRPVPYHWDRDLDGVNRAIRLINRLRPKPSFVMVTGDMVHGKPGCSMRQPQTKDILEAFAKLDSNIKLFVLPGNHDLDDSPTSDSLRDYTESWGDDYYSFKMSQTKFLVLNSQYLFDDSKCTQESAEFHRWLDLELETLKREEEQRPIVFQGIFTGMLSSPGYLTRIQIQYI
ncbi:unnamed protein product [Calicophoron daubneyi]|uniref:Calcineurin-like phosphoesterase domain-containing protein n=1 Tax=Calicophoron daubneyi TaxID=300641 RepID=A0AAV2TMV3_CALDB